MLPLSNREDRRRRCSFRYSPVRLAFQSVLPFVLRRISLTASKNLEFCRDCISGVIPSPVSSLHAMPGPSLIFPLSWRSLAFPLARRVGYELAVSVAGDKPIHYSCFPLESPFLFAGHYPR